ncbi:uncharacterized protein LOC131346866 [Hemibagrus wyckioides]|uniref:uncharacterized protein LOC131346866 n=1 Tax=Hemibagrus wyckioides TaxID=337641 RepID=UPI00266BA7A1|nr:uncharacterized protein LOC131346866 [Hemibagrus wyckioides]
MHKKAVFFPGCVKVVFRKGPLGYLLQEPTEEARLIKDNPSLPDKSAPKEEELVRRNALAVVSQRGGGASDKREVFGEYILQFGKYKGKSFRWLFENDIGYTVYLMKNLQQEEAAGVFTAEGPSKSSLLTFVQSLLSYTFKNPAAPTASSEGDQLVGFGARSKSTWWEIWDSRAVGYASFIMKTQTANSCISTTELEDADELESATLNISPSKLQSQSPPTPPSSSERFGLEYVEPGCRPVVLDWEKHKSKSTQAFSPAEQGRTPTAQSSDHPGDHDVTPSPQLESGRHFKLE